jgi:membrane protease YdiL (CAAX protease family)
VLLGPDGLRAGWRLLVYVLLVVITGSLVIAALKVWVPLGTPWVLMKEELIEVLAVILPALLMARLEGRRFGAYGLPLRGVFSRPSPAGALWGLATITLFLLALHGFKAYDFGNLALHGLRALKFAVFWGLFFALVGILEEFAFRGYTLFTLFDALGLLREADWAQHLPESDSAPFWASAVLLSAAFASVHLLNYGETAPGIAAVFCIGMFFCLTLRRTGTLWFAVGFHAAFDWGETYLYSVPNSGTFLPGHLLDSSLHGPRWLSGGPAGPEGSLLIFVVLAALAGGFSRAYPEVRYKLPAEMAGATEETCPTL